MKKIAIVTINHGSNYGNKLQNYAVQEIYQSMGFAVETIWFEPIGLTVGRTGTITIPKIVNKIDRHLKNYYYRNRVKRRQAVFKKFNNTYLKRSNRCYTPNDYEEIDETKYDFFSVGSDQVWNSFFYDFSPLYLLEFVHDSKKKIAYAASFGVNEISEKYFERFRHALSEFSYISVREVAGQELISKLNGHSAEVVIDPTLMLSSDEWVSFSSKIAEHPKKRYILTYFLGKHDKKVSRKIKQLAKKNSYEIINLNEITSIYYEAGPCEFVSLFRNAELIFTDSFHACCFSIQFHKVFWVLNRVGTNGDMNSRIFTLLNSLELTGQFYKEDITGYETIDYSECDEILKRKRVETQNFLEQALR